MSHEDIEATKAPLMDHLVELRSRLIKALLAFGVMFGICFVFAKDIYNILVWPFVWVAGPENSKFIYTALLEYFITQLKLAMFGAAFLSFPIVATQIYMFVAPGLYRHERKAFLPYLIATPIFFALGAAVVYFLVLPMLVRFSLGMQQTGSTTDACHRDRRALPAGTQIRSQRSTSAMRFTPVKTIPPSASTSPPADDARMHRAPGSRHRTSCGPVKSSCVTRG